MAASENHFCSQLSPVQYDFVLHKMAIGGHFECQRIMFGHIYRHIRYIRNFGCKKITFERISHHFTNMLYVYHGLLVFVTLLNVAISMLLYINSMTGWVRFGVFKDHG